MKIQIFLKQWVYLISLVILMAGTSQLQAEVYKAKDANGKVHFEDKKTELVEVGTVKIEPITSSNDPHASAPSEPVSASKTDFNYDPSSPFMHKKVVMYSASWCGYCKRARTFFHANSIPFKEYDVETSPEGKRDYENMHGKGVPIIFVDKEKLQGFNEASFLSLYQAK